MPFLVSVILKHGLNSWKISAFFAQDLPLVHRSFGELIGLRDIVSQAIVEPLQKRVVGGDGVFLNSFVTRFPRVNI